MSKLNSQSAQNLINTKRALRATMLARRDALAASKRAEASAKITVQLLALPAYRAAKTILAYMSIGSEFETGDFVRQVLADGKRLVLPRVDKISHKLVLHDVADLNDLVAGVWGIREPHIDSPLADLAAITFILVPGLAFDRACNRLGYGGGFYDRILQLAMATSDRVQPLQEPISTRVSGTFATQIIDAIPIGEHDQPVDLIITENEQIFNHI